MITRTVKGTVWKGNSWDEFIASETKCDVEVIYVADDRGRELAVAVKEPDGQIIEISIPLDEVWNELKRMRT